MFLRVFVSKKKKLEYLFHQAEVLARDDMIQAARLLQLSYSNLWFKAITAHNTGTHGTVSGLSPVCHRHVMLACLICVCVLAAIRSQQPGTTEAVPSLQ